MNRNLWTIYLYWRYSTGLASYNFKNHVASDIGNDQLFLPSECAESEQFKDNICDWTNLQQMKLNENKSKVNRKHIMKLDTIHET